MRENDPDTQTTPRADDAPDESAMLPARDEQNARDEAPSAGHFAPRRFAHMWIVVAGLCLFAAAMCLLSGRISAAFVVAVLGVLAWFLNLRARLRDTIPVAEEQDGE